MRVTGLNHVSISSVDVETSVRFYVEVLGLEPIDTYTFAFPTRYLRLGDVQLHVFQREKGTANCLVEASAADVANYVPPEGVDRRGAIGGQRKRRTYRQALGVIEDALLGEKVAWGGRDLGAALHEAIEALLQREALAVMGG